MRPWIWWGLLAHWVVAVGCGPNGGEPHGVWTDPATGLVWQVEASGDYLDWSAAVAACDALALAGWHDWRLPEISELRTLIRGCEETGADGECTASDDCADMACQTEACWACTTGQGPNQGCFGPEELNEPCLYAWSDTLVTDSLSRAWAVGFSSGFVYKPRIYYSFHARCVR